jgi:hypothetical protein
MPSSLGAEEVVIVDFDLDGYTVLPVSILRYNLIRAEFDQWAHSDRPLQRHSPSMMDSRIILGIGK